MKKVKLNLRTLVYLLLAGAFAYAIYRYQDQLVNVVEVLRDGIWYFVGGAFLVLALTIYNQARLYASIFRLFGLPAGEREMVPLYLVRRFVSVVAPSSGFSGWVPFFQFARKRDIGAGAVFAANLVYTILWYSSFFIFLFLGLLTLFIAHDLRWFEISAALFMLVTDVIMIVGLVLAWVAPRALTDSLRWVGRAFATVFSWLRREPPLQPHQFVKVAEDLTGAVEEMRQAGWPKMSVPVAHAVLNEALNILILFLVGLAFGVQLHFGVLVAAYSTSILFWVVSPTPGGLGFVEGTLIVVLTTLGVKAGNAAVITLAYRGITFWAPFLLGFLALRWLNRYPGKPGGPKQPGEPVRSLAPDDPQQVIH